MLSDIKSIGGFLGLEHCIKPNGNVYHKSYLLAYGRNCLRVIFDNIKIDKIYIPYYICDSVIDVLDLCGISYDFYNINFNFELNQHIRLQDNEYLLLLNFNGIKDDYIDAMSERYNNNLIIDNTQSFFHKPGKKSWAFNSIRKFLGVHDGAYLFVPELVDINIENYNTNVSNYDYLISRYYTAHNSYKYFVEYEKNIDQNIKLASKITNDILYYIDYERIKHIRKNNFIYFQKKFAAINMINLNYVLSTNCVPICYPLLLQKKIDRNILYNKEIYVPQYWPKQIRHDGFKLENLLIDNLLSIPIDQRMSEYECKLVCDVIEENL
jgi:hypothetical protein